MAGISNDTIHKFYLATQYKALEKELVQASAKLIQLAEENRDLKLEVANLKTAIEDLEYDLRVEQRRQE